MAVSSKKVVIVTGGGRGIGAGIARRLLFQNMHVVIAELQPSHKEFSALEMLNILFVKTDVRKEVSIKQMVKSTIDHFGRIDALINNAGVLLKEKNPTPVEKLSLGQWQNFIDTNLTGPFLCAKYAIPYLKKQNGSIINIASTKALQSEKYSEPYSASKGGLVSLTHALAISLGPQIRVNCISPGWINTGKWGKLKAIDHTQHPVGRVGKVEDIASMVSFLISDEASFITGQNFIVDGGMTRKMIYAE